MKTRELLRIIKNQKRMCLGLSGIYEGTNSYNPHTTDCPEGFYIQDRDGFTEYISCIFRYNSSKLSLPKDLLGIRNEN